MLILRNVSAALILFAFGPKVEAPSVQDKRPELFQKGIASAG